MTLNDVSTALGNAKLYYISQLAQQRLLMLKGRGCVNSLIPIPRLIRGLSFQYNAGVLDDRTNALYTCLLKAIAGFTGNYMPDPNVVIPGTTINITVDGAVVQAFNRTEANLLPDGIGGYYLPFIDDSGQPFAANIKPLELTIDGVGITLQPNYDFVPMRLYGFANNVTQTITLTVI